MNIRRDNAGTVDTIQQWATKARESDPPNEDHAAILESIAAEASAATSGAERWLALRIASIIDTGEYKR